MFKFKLFLGSICISLLCAGLFCSSAYAAVDLIVNDDGQLLGATNVLVGEGYYDVLFIDDSVDNLYSDDGAFTFTFTTQTAALAASAALLDQVFIEDFDDDPTLTNGIEYSGYAYVYTPYEQDADTNKLNMAYAFNSKEGHSDPDTTDVFYDMITSYDTISMSGQVFAVWTPQNAVPVPGTILLLGSGIIGLTGLSRKQYFNKA